MDCLLKTKPISCLFWPILIIVGLYVGTQADPLQHKLNGYVTREGYWSNIYQLSSFTIGGIESFDSSFLHAYVVRAKWENEIIPGKFTLYKDGRCYIIYDGVQIDCTSSYYEFLYNESYFSWVERQDGDICNGAIVGGIATNFEKYYICQFDHFHEGWNKTEVLLGNLVPSKGLCFAGWYSAEFSSSLYRVLADSRYSAV